MGSWRQMEAAGASSSGHAASAGLGHTALINPKEGISGLPPFRSFRAAESPLPHSHQRPCQRVAGLWVQVAHPTPLLGLSSADTNWTPFLPEPGMSRR